MTNSVSPTARQGTQLPFKLKLLMIAILPIVVVAMVTGTIIHIGAGRLIEIETGLVKKRILTSRQQELKNYSELALTAIDHEYSQTSLTPQDELKAQMAVRKILQNLNYGEDGYFFAYDRHGRSLVHAASPELIGANLWDLQDSNGGYIIRELVDKAIKGGGFHTYTWEKPSTGTQTLKLGYATYLPKWEWMLGTGLYLDDIADQVNAFEADMRSQTRNAEMILFILALLAVVVTAVAVAATHYSEHKLADERLKALTRRIVDIQEEERKRVSNDLHDGINQLLVSIRHRLELAIDQFDKPEKAMPLLTKSLTILDSSISDIRRISKALHPSALDNIGLSVAIRELAHDFSESAQIGTAVTVHDVDDRLTDAAKIALYRVLQEALTNITRHAQATMVRIELQVDDRSKTVNLRIADNGIGLNGNETPGKTSGLGLRNMHERMESHGGTLVLRDAISGGLELIATLPQS